MALAGREGTRYEALAGRLRSLGCSYRRIATELDMSERSAWLLVNGNGRMPCPGCGEPMTGSELCQACRQYGARVRREQIIELWGEGLGPSAVAEVLGIKAATVMGVVARLRRAGHDLPDRRGRNRPRSPGVHEVAIVDWLRVNPGSTQAEVCAGIGASQSWVSRMLRRLRGSGVIESRGRRPARWWLAGSAEQTAPGDHEGATGVRW